MVALPIEFHITGAEQNKATLREKLAFRGNQNQHAGPDF
jgi:hypothetical protein